MDESNEQTLSFFSLKKKFDKDLIGVVDRTDKLLIVAMDKQTGISAYFECNLNQDEKKEIAIRLYGGDDEDIKKAIVSRFFADTLYDLLNKYSESP